MKASTYIVLATLVHRARVRPRPKPTKTGPSPSAPPTSGVVNAPSASEGAIPVEVRRNAEGGWTLYRGGEPYYIRGVGGQQYLDRAVAYGANSIRTWGAGEAIAVLDEAHEKGLSVVVRPLGRAGAAGLRLQRRPRRRGAAGPLPRGRPRLQGPPGHPDVGPRQRERPLLLGPQGLGRAQRHRGDDPRGGPQPPGDARDGGPRRGGGPAHQGARAGDRRLRHQHVRRARRRHAGVPLVRLRGPERRHHAPAGGLGRPLRHRRVGTRRPLGGPEDRVGRPHRTDEQGEGADVPPPLRARHRGRLLALHRLIRLPLGPEAGDDADVVRHLHAGRLRDRGLDVLQHLWTGAWPENRAPSMEGLTANGQTAFDDVYVDAPRRGHVRGDRHRPRGRGARATSGSCSPRARTSAPAATSRPAPTPCRWTSWIRTSGRWPSACPQGGPYRMFVYAYDGHGNVATANFPFYVGSRLPRYARPSRSARDSASASTRCLPIPF